MRIAHKVDLDEVMQAVEDDDMSGFCLECGELNAPVEPDAEKYECDSCGAHMVYGAEQILIMFC